jgi:hypothetical protein
VTRSPFWAAVRKLAAMRANIPPERRAMSGVRELFAQQSSEAKP